MDVEEQIKQFEEQRGITLSPNQREAFEGLAKLLSAIWANEAAKTNQ